MTELETKKAEVYAKRDALYIEANDAWNESYRAAGGALGKPVDALVSASRQANDAYYASCDACNVVDAEIKKLKKK